MNIYNKVIQKNKLCKIMSKLNVKKLKNMLTLEKWFGILLLRPKKMAVNDL